MIVKEKEQIRLINKGIIGNFGETSKIWMGTPLYDNQEIIGAMVVQSYQDSEAYTEDDLEILQFIAEKISSLIIQKKAQDELKVVQHRLETATSMLRHDIANGLSVIKSALKLYRHTNQPNFLDEIDKRIKKSLSLIDSHREQERFIDAHPNLNEYKIKDVIKKIIPSYPNIQFNIDGDIIIYADDAIYSVFENLIFNSVKYRKADTIKISFTHSTGKCEILYSDNGLKIDKTTENNFSENNVFEKNIGKTGIGLYLVKRIIESYSGGIYYIRKGEAGANFIIRINCPLHNTINH
jgi:signal transduction histidine kinase